MTKIRRATTTTRNKARYPPLSYFINNKLFNMKTKQKIWLSIMTCVAFFSCSSPVERQLFGTWSRDTIASVGEREKFAQHERLIFYDDNSFMQEFTYTNSSTNDTIAKSIITGAWNVSKNNIMMNYDTCFTTTSLKSNLKSQFHNSTKKRVTPSDTINLDSTFMAQKNGAANDSTITITKRLSDDSVISSKYTRVPAASLD